MRRLFTSIAVAALVLSTAGPAAAGGWWSFIPLQGAELGVGERFASGRGETLFLTAEAAARARSGEDPYHAYLIPEIDWRIANESASAREYHSRWARPHAAIRVGSVKVWGGSRNYARFRVVFDVPDATPGPYVLALCSEGCAAPLGDVVPSQITLVADPVAARTAREVGKLDWRVNALGQRANHLERQIRALRGAGTDPEVIEAIDALTVRAEKEARRVQELEARVEELEGAAPAPAWLVVGAAGAALLLLLPRRRRPRGRPPEPPVEMELEALPDSLADDEPIRERGVAPVPPAPAQPAARPLTPVRARAAAPHRAATAR
ncbi:MAG TPA: hypothetical protein VF058_04775, partial [Actinomycetota bacterium]